MKLLDYSGLQRFLNKIKTLLDSKANTGHTHVTSEVTDLLDSQHTWSAQQSYSADLNLNYANTDVDDILDTVAGSYTAEDFLAQNNVWTGNNTYTKTVAIERNKDSGNFLVLKNTEAELGSLPSSITPATIAFRDKNDENLSYMGAYYDTDGSNRFRLYVKNKFTSGAPDTSGTEDFAYFGLRLNPDNSKEGVLRGTFRPYDNGSYSLGSSSYQWNNLYAKKYYYNGTQWGLDQTNEWTGSNKFKSSSTNFGFQSTVAEAGSLTASSNWMYWLDKNGYQDAYISRDFWNDGGDTLRISISGKRANGAPSTSGTAVECGIRLDIAANGTKSVNPFVSNDTDLGSSALRWRNLYTSDVSTDLVESFPGGNCLLLRSTDQTWENGARMFLYSNTHPGQTNGSIYIDVDHGDGNNTKTGLTLVPNAFHPQGGTVNTTYGVSLGTATHQWAKVYAEQYYYNGTAWGLDKGNTWTEGNVFTKSILFKNTDITDYKSNPSSDTEKWIQFWSNEWRYWGGVGHVYLTTGVSEIRIAMTNWRTNGSQGYWHLDFGTDKNFSQVYFRPSGNAFCGLGDNDHKWAYCHAVNFYENGTALSSKYAHQERWGIGTIIFGYVTKLTLKNAYSNSNVTFGKEFNGDHIYTLNFYLWSGLTRVEWSNTGRQVSVGTWEWLGETIYFTSLASDSDRVCGVFRRKA